MPNYNIPPIQGFKSFTSMWYDACKQISEEIIPDTMDNDIKLFCILRAVVLYSGNTTFIHSHKLNDFNAISPKVRTTMDTPFGKRAHISWNHFPQPYPSHYYPRPKIKVAPNTPAPVSLLRAGNTKILSYNNHIKIQDDCVFEPTEQFEPNEKLYMVIDNDFIAKLDSTCVLYPVSRNIVMMYATNQRNNINLKTFQELTENMYKKLVALREKRK